MSLTDPLRSAPPARSGFDEITLLTVREARRRLAQDAGDADALFVLASWYLLLGKASKTLRALDRLAEVAPEYPGVQRFRAQVYRKLGDEAMARRCEESAQQEES